MSDDKILTFDLGLKKQRKRGVKKRGFNRCNHNQMLADEHNKVLECSECGFIMHPWDYVFNMAKKEESIFNHLKYTKMEQIKLNEDLVELKRKINNAKAQLRRATKTA